MLRKALSAIAVLGGMVGIGRGNRGGGDKPPSVFTTTPGAFSGNKPTNYKVSAVPSNSAGSFPILKPGSSTGIPWEGGGGDSGVPAARRDRRRRRNIQKRRSSRS